jgi:hypothetical protein
MPNAARPISGGSGFGRIDREPDPEIIRQMGAKQNLSSQWPDVEGVVPRDKGGLVQRDELSQGDTDSFLAKILRSITERPRSVQGSGGNIPMIRSTEGRNPQSLMEIKGEEYF